MKYVKKAVPVEAFQWDGGTTPNPKWMDEFADKGKISLLEEVTCLRLVFSQLVGLLR